MQNVFFPLFFSLIFSSMHQNYSFKMKQSQKIWHFPYRNYCHLYREVTKCDGEAISYLESHTLGFLDLSASPRPMGTTRFNCCWDSKNNNIMAHFPWLQSKNILWFTCFLSELMWPYKIHKHHCFHPVSSLKMVNEWWKWNWSLLI